MLLLHCPPESLARCEQYAITTRRPRFNCTQTAVSGMQQRFYLATCLAQGTDNPLLQWDEPVYEDRGDAVAIAARQRWIVAHIDDPNNDTEKDI